MTDDARLLCSAHRFVSKRSFFALRVRMTGAKVSGTTMTEINPTNDERMTTRYCVQIP